MASWACRCRHEPRGGKWPTREYRAVRVLFIHFRSAPSQSQQAVDNPGHSAGTDGVSLEMMKREQVLREMGHEVAMCSALAHATFPIPQLEFESEAVTRLRRDLFRESDADIPEEGYLLEIFQRQTDDLYKELHQVVASYHPDLVMVHNVFCLPLHLAATVALERVLSETQVPCAATHHDVLSEGAYTFQPSYPFIREILDQYFPPTGPRIRHATINTRNQKALAARGTQAVLMPDTMDFDEPWEPDIRRDLRNELRAKYGIGPNDVVLCAMARLVPNKQLELAGQLAKAVADRRMGLAGTSLYHDGVFPPDGRVVLLLVGRPERDFQDYKDRLFKSLDGLSIDWQYIGDDVRPVRAPEQGVYALYPDSYALADVILYPSGWEGFGNQLLEAICVQLPIVVFEYPVFKEDIVPTGIRGISLGDQVLETDNVCGLVTLPAQSLERAADEIVGLLRDAQAYEHMVETNAALGHKHFGAARLRAHVEEIVTWADRLTAASE